jgi:hypothetical protein
MKTKSRGWQKAIGSQQKAIDSQQKATNMTIRCDSRLLSTRID